MPTTSKWKLRRGSLNSLYYKDAPLNGHVSFRIRTNQDKILNNIPDKSKWFRKLIDGIAFGDKESFEEAIKEIRTAAFAQGVNR